MLFLMAIIRARAPRDPDANDLWSEARLRVGHLALTVIALVYVLLTFWQSP